MAKLGEVCLLKAGKFVSANDISPEYNKGLYPCFGGNGIRGYVADYTHDGEFPLIGRQGALCGNVNLASGKFHATEHAVVVQPKIEMNVHWLYYALNAMNLGQYATGAAQPGLAVSKLETLSIEIPNISEQNKIAQTLYKVEQLVNFRKQQLAKLDELVKARFVEMFGSYPENENAYPVVNVSDIADAGVGVVIKPAQYYVTEERGIKAFRSLNIGEMYIKDSDWVYFSTEGNESNKKSQLHENDLLIVRSGAPGTSCVVTKEFEGCNAVDVIIAHPNLSKVNPWYLCAYINYPHGKKQIEEGTGGAAQQHFNVGKCNNLKVLLPPLEPQNQFAAFVERVNQQKQTVQQSLEKLELLKKALMQEYFG
jgi:type I restriction enzyme S subunit